MITFIKSRLFVLAVVTAGLPLSAVAQRPTMPEGDSLCHVLTENGFDGVVLVQTSEIADAAVSARSAMAWELSGNRARAEEVVECVVLPEEALSDAEVQRFYEGLVL